MRRGLRPSKVMIEYVKIRLCPTYSQVTKRLSPYHQEKIISDSVTYGIPKVAFTAFNSKTRKK